MSDKKDHPGFFIWAIIGFLLCISFFPGLGLLVQSVSAVACGLVVSRTGLAKKFPLSLALYIPALIKWLVFIAIVIAVGVYLL